MASPALPPPPGTHSRVRRSPLAQATPPATTDAPVSRLAALGIHGFDRVEPVVLAALVTEDPLLLIGRSGTGKTFLLNTLSEALGLEHRHYNASLISFDDLVGFPYPDKGGQGVKFLETPATVWSAESVLIDEISRCKPEHQNRLFSLVHERRVQGIALARLRFRWAAMNPCSADQDALEQYTGSEPLDPALADRFALFVEALDWDAFSEAERRRIADPAGEGKVASDAGRLRGEIEGWRRLFLAEVERVPEVVLAYVTAVVTALHSAGVRVSPRRSRLLARSLIAARLVAGASTSAIFRLVLDCSLPHCAWGARPAVEVVAAAHRLAWEAAAAAGERWLHLFLAEPSLPKKLAILLGGCPSPDAGTKAVSALLSQESRERAAAFAFALYPAAARRKLPVGSEGINDLARIAGPILRVDGTVTWQERLNTSGTNHPDLDRFARALGGKEVTGGRAARAKQFFNWCLVEKVLPKDPAALEAELAACVELLRERGLT